MHYLPIGCLQSLSDKRNDFVNNEDVAVSSLPLCVGVCVCLIHSSAKQLSINWVIVFTRLAPVIRPCVTSPNVFVCICGSVFFNSFKAAVIKVALEESPIRLV